MRRLSKVAIVWSPAFAYAIGLLATDGNLSKDGRHLNMTSKDKELIVTFRKCLELNNKIGRKTREKSKVKKYFQIQFGDRNFYDFLLGIGLTPAKSKTIKNLEVPRYLFADFLRGCIDGDGNIGAFKHPESRFPQLRIRLYSASLFFLEWIKSMINECVGIKSGWIEGGSGVWILVYAKADSIRLLKFMYYPKVEHYLKRKYAMAEPFLRA